MSSCSRRRIGFLLTSNLPSFSDRKCRVTMMGIARQRNKSVLAILIQGSIENGIEQQRYIKSCRLPQ